VVGHRRVVAGCVAQHLPHGDVEERRRDRAPARGGELGAGELLGEPGGGDHVDRRHATVAAEPAPGRDTDRVGGNDHRDVGERVATLRCPDRVGQRRQRTRGGDSCAADAHGRRSPAALAAIERNVAPGHGAGAVHRPQRPSLGPVGAADGATGVEHDAGRIDDDRRDQPIAQRAPDGCGRHRQPGSGLTDGMLVESAGGGGAVVDDVGDVGEVRPHTMVAAGDESTQRFGGEPVPVDRAVDELDLSGLFALGDHGREFAVDRAEDLLRELGMEREPALDHARRRVHLPGQERLLPLSPVALDALIPLQPPGAVAARSAEALRRHPGRVVEQLVLHDEQRIAHVVVELRRRVRQGVDVLGADRAVGKGLAEPGCLVDGLGASFLALPLRRRHPATPGVQIGRGRGAGRGVQLSHPGRDPRFDGVDPTTNLSDGGQEVGAPGAVARRRVDGVERRQRLSEHRIVHAAHPTQGVSQGCSARPVSPPAAANPHGRRHPGLDRWRAASDLQRPLTTALSDRARQGRQRA
jgi:hypothetical protein